MKTKVNIVRGTPLYKYKSSYVVFPPDGTFVKEMIYDSERNCTEIILKKHTIITEVICSIILIALVVIKFLDINSINTIYFDSTPLYYNENLYLNMETSATNFSNFKVIIYNHNNEIIESKTLEKGDSWITVSCDYQKEYVIELITKNVLGIEKSKRCKLNTVSYDLDIVDKESKI